MMVADTLENNLIRSDSHRTRGLVDLGVRISRGGHLPFSQELVSLILELYSLILGLSIPNFAYTYTIKKNAD